MTIYEFTLTTPGDPTEHAEALFELAEGDIIPEGGGKGSGVLHVSREAHTLGEAIRTTIQDVENLGITIAGVAADDLITLHEAANRVGRTYESMRLLAVGKRGRGHFPVPQTAGNFSLYSWAEIAKWFGDALPVDFTQQIAAADHLVRARGLLSQAEREDLAQVVNA